MKIKNARFLRSIALLLILALTTGLFGCAKSPKPKEFGMTTVSGPMLLKTSGTVLRLFGNEMTFITDDFSTRDITFKEDAIRKPPQGVEIGYPVRAYYAPTEEGDVFYRVIVSDFSVCTPEQEAHHRMMTLSLEEKVGQMFIVRCPSSAAAEKAADYRLGGYILFARDFDGQTPETISEKIQSYQQAAGIPMLIGVDEEGGTVVRVSRFGAFRDRPFSSPQGVYAKGGWEGIERDTKEKCALLSSLGINLNLAPVCDVSTSPRDFIYARAFGQDAAQTAEFSRRVVESMEGTGVGCVLKHFPGYGNNVDTHTGIAIDKREKSTFEQEDFLPFVSGIEAGADSVLVAHNIVECFDAEMPASLSKPVHDLLREELGFTGVIMTDDLYMDAIRQYIGTSAAAVAAVRAGNDMLCCTDFETQYPAVLEAVKNGEIDISQINASVERVLAWKIRLGLFS